MDAACELGGVLQAFGGWGEPTRCGGGQLAVVAVVGRAEDGKAGGCVGGIWGCMGRL